MLKDANDEPSNHLDCSGPTGSTAVGVSPFLCDQRSIPPHQRIRCDQRAEFAERLATQHTCSACESATFGIRESEASIAKAFLQQSIFFLEILDHIELPAIDPASKHRQEELQRLDGGHLGKYIPLRTIGPADR